LQVVYVNDDNESTDNNYHLFGGETMSDSTEEYLKPVPVTKGSPMIYTTGAFISPTMRVIDGEEVWMWVVEEFTDDSYMDGKVCLPKEFAYSSDDLLKVDVEEGEESE
jgi:hypothetical protein